MSGLFRYNSNSLTPIRQKNHYGSTNIDDGTMDNSSSFGYRSPSFNMPLTGNTSPGQVRSLREHNEKLNGLRKENFNLKLRIYFLEEKNTNTANADGTDTLFKQNVDLKVETEALRQELKEKQELLCEAATAMELMEQEHQKNKKEGLAIIEELHQKIQFLELEIKALVKPNEKELDKNTKCCIDKSKSQMDHQQKIVELEEYIRQYEIKTSEMSSKLNIAEFSIKEKEEKIRTYDEKLLQLSTEIAELKAELNLKKEVLGTDEFTISTYKSLVESLQKNILNLESQFTQIKAEKLENERQHEAMKELIICLMKTTDEENFMLNRKILFELFDEKTLYQLQYGRREKSFDDNFNKTPLAVALESTKTMLSPSRQSFLANPLFSNLNLCRRSQESLWKSENTSKVNIENVQSCLLPKFDPIFYISETTKQHQIESSSTNTVITFKSDEKVNQLKNQLYETKMKMAEKECMVQVLEEDLAQKTIAVEKGCKTIQYMMMKTKSLESELAQLKGDTGKIENMNDVRECVRVNDPSVTNETEMNSVMAQLKSALLERDEALRWGSESAKMCATLMPRLTELAEFLDSLLKHKDIIGSLTNDRRKAMRKAIDNSFDLSKSLNNISISYGRFSLNEVNLGQFNFLSDILNNSLANLDITEAWGDRDVTNRNNISQGVAFEDEIRNGDQLENKTFSHLLDGNSESEAWSEPDRRVSHARIGLENTSKLLPNSVARGSSNSTTVSENEVRKVSRKNSVSKLQEQISKLETEIANKDSKISEIEKKLMENIEEFAKERSSYKSTLNETMDSLQKYKENEVKMKNDLSENNSVINDLRNNLDETLQKMNEISLERAKIQEHIIQLERQIKERDQKILNVQSQLVESDNILTKERWDSRQQIDDLMERVEILQEAEAELKAELSENEKSMRTLKKNLDDITIQASKAVLDRTKALNEKLTMEKTNTELLNRLDDYTLQKTELNKKIGSLERLNAQLQNQLVKKDATNYQLTRSASHGNARYAMNYARSTSGYTSDDMKYRPENSSPDLGIDSDAGRTSGSEILQKLNLSTENILREKDEIKSIVSGNENENPNIGACTKFTNQQHNCEKIEQENADLKRRLKNMLTHLRISNSRKEHLERDIRRELSKTQNVLKSVRTNFENAEKTGCKFSGKLEWPKDEQ